MARLAVLRRFAATTLGETDEAVRGFIVVGGAAAAGRAPPSPHPKRWSFRSAARRRARPSRRRSPTAGTAPRVWLSCHERRFARRRPRPADAGRDGRKAYAAAGPRGRAEAATAPAALAAATPARRARAQSAADPKRSIPSAGSARSTGRLTAARPPAPCQPPRTGLPADHVRYRAGRPASARHASCRPAGPEAAPWGDRRAGRAAAGSRRGALAAGDRPAGSEDRRSHRRRGNLCRALRLRRPCGGGERGIALRYRPAVGGLAARAAFLRLAPAPARRRHAARPLQCARHRGGLAGALSPARRRDRLGDRGGRAPRALLPRPVAARPARRRPRPLSQTSSARCCAMPAC